MSLPSLFPVCWPSRRKNVMSKSVKISVSMLLMTHFSCQESSLAIGSTIMTLSRNNSCHNRKPLHLYGWRRYDRTAAQSKNALVIFLFNIHSTMHQEFVPQCQTTNQEFYCNILRWLGEDIQWKQLDLRQEELDDSCWQCTLSLRFPLKWGSHWRQHGINSALVDFHLFSKMKL